MEDTTFLPSGNQFLTDVNKLLKEATNKAIKNSSLELPLSNYQTLHDSKENIIPPWSSPINQESTICPTINKENNPEEDDDESKMNYISGNESFEIGLALFGGSGVEKELLKQLTKSFKDVQSLGNQQQLLSKLTFLIKYYECRIHIEESYNMKDDDGSLVNGCSTLSKAKHVLKDIYAMVSTLKEQSDEDSEEVKSAQFIRSALHNQIRNLHCDYYSIITKLFDYCFTTTDDSIMIRNKGIGLSDAFDALISLSTGYNENEDEDEEHLLKEVMKSLCGRLYKDALLQFMGQDIIEYQIREINDVEEDIDNTTSNSLIWRMKRGEEVVPTTDVWLKTINAISEVLNFTSQYILFNRKELCSIMSEYLFLHSTSSIFPKVNIPPFLESKEYKGPLVTKLLNIFYNTCIPNEQLSNISKLNDIILFIRSDTLEFEHSCSNFMTNDDLPFVSNIDLLQEKYGSKRRIVTLSQARDILLKDDYYNTTIVGTDDQQQQYTKEKGIYPDNIDPDFVLNDKAKTLFTLPRCSISIVSSNIMKLCRDVLNESVSVSSSSSSIAHILYRTSRDLFDLYRTLIPATYGSDIATTPRTAAICHNDCVYFAHTLLTLGLEYQHKFSSSEISKICSFVDIIPSFREMAEQTMSKMVSNQKLQLKSLFEELYLLHDILRSNEAVMEWSNIEKTIRAINYHLYHLSQSWSTPVLSFDIYGRCMGILVDTLLDTIIQEIIKAKDISEAASHFVTSLFTDVIHSCNQIFQDESSSQFCKHWEKFITIRKFMNMSLDDITLGLSDGTFYCLSSYELCDLICATFDDGVKRRNILKVLDKVDK